MDRNDTINDYLFGELSPEDRARFEQQMANDPQLAAEVKELDGIVLELEALPTEAWENVEPPALRISDAIARERAAVAPVEAPAAARDSRVKDKQPGLIGRFFGGSLALKPAFAFAAVALFFVAGIGVGQISGSDDSVSPVGPSLQQASLMPVGEVDAAASGKADLKKDGQVIRIKLSGLKPSGDDDFYEAWLMDPKNGLVGIGTFRVGDDGQTTLDLPVPVGTKEFPIVDISLQPVDGKPTHSGVSVLRGTLN